MDVKDVIKKHLSAQRDKFKQNLLENLKELYFLKNDGRMCDYHVWIAKEKISGVIDSTKEEDISSEEKFFQLLNLKFDELPIIAPDLEPTNDSAPQDSPTKLPLHSAPTTTSAASTPATPAAATPSTSPSAAISTNKSTTATHATITESIAAAAASAVATSTSTPKIPTTHATTISIISTDASTAAVKATSTTTTATTSPINETSPSPVNASAVSEIISEESSKRKRSVSPELDGPKLLLNNSSTRGPLEKKLREESPVTLDEPKSSRFDDATSDQLNGASSSIEVDVIRVSTPVEPKPISSHSKKESPTRISKVVDTIVTPTAISAENVQKQIFERAKHEAAVTARISELRKQGLWSAKRLPKLQEPPRPKTHWDYLLEEMKWLATDFDQERKWKRKTAKKCALMVYRHFQEKRVKKEREEQAPFQQLKKLAAAQAKEVRSFWSSIEKIVNFRHQTKLEETRKKAWGLHLNYILDQTSKFSNTCLEDTKKSTKDLEIDYLMGQDGENAEKEPVINVSILPLLSLAM